MNKSGIILIILGCLFLAGNFGLLQWSSLQKWWPLILIGVGLWTIIGHRSGGRGVKRDDEKDV